MGFDHEDGIDFEKFNAKYGVPRDIDLMAALKWLEKTATHESVIGVYIYPYKTGMMSISVELSSGRVIEGCQRSSLAAAVQSASEHLQDYFEANYETL